MGSKMQAKFDSSCKICNKTWKIDEPIFYQKDPKSVCSDQECFEKQGGKLFTGPFTPRSKGSFRPYRSAEEKQKDVETFLAIPQVAEIFAKLTNAEKVHVMASIYNCK